MDDYKLLTDLHVHGLRQGPGGDDATEMAINLAMIDRTAPLEIADIGCGTGASTVLLAKLLNARITAVDFLPEFLDVLRGRAESAGVADRIATLECCMDDLPFGDGEFDVIWSEGAIYNIGFARGVADWRRCLKPGGLLVVSEITWTTDSRPEEIENHWNGEYPEIDTASAKIRILEESGYSPAGYFVLPGHCWLEQYYRPMQSRFGDFLERNGNSPQARAIVAAEQAEIELYEKYGNYYSYGVYVAKKL